LAFFRQEADVLRNDDDSKEGGVRNFPIQLMEADMHRVRQYGSIVVRFVMFACIALQTVPAISASDEAPDVLVKRISQEVIDTAKNDKSIQAGNRQHIFNLVEAKILPYVDIQRTTAMAAGRFWRQATPEQQQQLVNEFQRLLMFTYSGALSRVKDQKLQFKPLRASAEDQEVEVRSEVIQPRGEPIQLNYRLAKTPAGWKIYDLNVLGAWLVESYKMTFSSEISKSGIDGLIKALAEKNKRLATAKPDSKEAGGAGKGRSPQNADVSQ
jgi:phospholipid transport system substrate-binding protein